ncbi:hypothetical protein GCM10020221_29450 [Streptomyces thioluteus]|uniref:GH18 domain-containing protein n=1 Tax=Streptomyces thioluteus TaxID=66431 RepID=A0ABN3WY18_STRTU
MASAALVVLPAGPAQASPLRSTPVLAYNMLGADGGSKWTTNIGRYLRAAEIVAVQEAGAIPIGEFVNRSAAIPGLPAIGRANYIQHHRWRFSHESYEVYFLQTDQNGGTYVGNRNNVALVTQREADEVTAIPNPYSGGRAMIGVRFGTAWYFSYHAMSGGGNDARTMLARVDDFVSQRPGNEEWTVLGDFNREPSDLVIPAGSYIYNTGLPTHIGRKEFDYAVSSANIADHPVTRQPGASADHFAVAVGGLRAQAEPRPLFENPHYIESVPYGLVMAPEKAPWGGEWLNPKRRDPEDSSQRFDIEFDDKVGFRIREPGGKCATVSENVPQSVSLYDCSNSSNQRFDLVSLGNDQYQIRDLRYGRCLEVFSSESTMAGLYPCGDGAGQHWTFPQTHQDLSEPDFETVDLPVAYPGSEGLQNLYTGQMLTGDPRGLPATTVRAEQREPFPTPTRAEWTMDWRGEYLRLHSPAAGECVEIDDPPAGSDAPAGVDLKPCTSSSAQLWKVLPYKGEAFRLQSRVAGGQDGLCLSLPADDDPGDRWDIVVATECASPLGWQIWSFAPYSTATDQNDPLQRSLRYGPTPPPDPEPVIKGRAARSVSAAADHATCRPDGMTATKGVDTPYCLIYDDQGREIMGERHPRRTVGYFTGWRTGRNGQPMYLPRSIPWGQLSHVNYAFAHVDKNNRISVGDVNDPDNPATGMTWPQVPGADMDASLPYKGNFNLLNKYKKQHPRVRTLISVGGWAETGGILKPDGSREKSGGLYTVTNRADGSVNQAAINTFADSVVEFLRTYGFNGVDIDYEYPTSLKDAGNPEDWPVANPRRKGLNAGNTALMKTLREKLDAASAADNKYYQLTAAASASGYLLRGQEDFRALQYLDFVNTMSYDYHGSWNNYVGPQAPLYDDGKDVELAATGIYDKAKNPEYQQEGFFNTDWSYHYFRGALQAGRINMGVPYYTRGWKDVQGGQGNGLWGISKLKDQSQCPDGTGPNGGTTECGSGASGIDNLWHDQTAAGDELAAGSNPMWHAKNLERGAVTSYLPRFGLDPKDPANRTDGYTRHWNGTLKASWLWHKDKKVFLSTHDTQDTAAKADYIKNKGAGGAMIWELAGDYECPDDTSGQCVPGYTLTRQLDDAQRGAGPYGATRAGKTELPSQVLDADMTFAKYPTDNKDLWPLQPKLRITNRGDKTIAGGAKVSFDLPTSAPSVIKDGNWQPYKDVNPGHLGPNVGGLKGEFHRVTITLEKCQEIPAGRSMDIPVKYYLPATGPANVTITSEGKTFGITGDRRHGTQTVAPPAGSAQCSAVKWDPKKTYDKGDVVTHKGKRWLAQYWADKGDEPGVAPVWRNISPND